MPELPEVETIRIGLEPALVGRTFLDVEISDSRLTRPEDPAVVAAELRGERVEAVDRRGKYVVVRFETERALLIHLRMTGTLLISPRGSLADDPYRRAVVTLDNESDVVYRDVRRFGTWMLAEPGELEPYLTARLGREPLSRGFTEDRLAMQLAGRRAPVKSVLLDQRTLAGVGNIYADEALWYAELHPLRPAGELSTQEVGRLRVAIRRALRTGIARQGATLSDYRAPDGRRGSMQTELRVYGRADEPCLRCGAPVAKTRVSGRGTWFCPNCQK